jgi:hypothetical protein
MGIQVPKNAIKDCKRNDASSGQGNQTQQPSLEKDGSTQLQTFSVVASKKPIKAEVVLEFSPRASNADNSLTIDFCYPVNSVYNKTVVVHTEKQ